MEKRTRSFLYLTVTLLVWVIIAIIVIQNPVIEEPEGLPPEAWSYYSGRPAFEVFLLKNRDAILFILFLCSIVPELVFLITDYLR